MQSCLFLAGHDKHRCYPVFELLLFEPSLSQRQGNSLGAMVWVRSLLLLPIQLSLFMSPADQGSVIEILPWLQLWRYTALGALRYPVRDHFHTYGVTFIWDLLHDTSEVHCGECTDGLAYIEFTQTGRAVRRLPCLVLPLLSSTLPARVVSNSQT